MKRENIMSDILYEAAKAYEKISEYDYMLTLGNRKYKILITSIATENELFHHVIGLGHLTDVRKLDAKTLRQKNAIYKSILEGNITFNDIKNSTILYSPICDTFNRVTNLPYTYYDRIQSFSKAVNYFDNAYKGKMYKWNINKSNIIMPNGNVRHSTIKADYLLKIPSFENKDEFFYCFLHQLNSKASKDGVIELNAHSIFFDCINLSQGQQQPYTILEEKKINIKTHEEILLYQHPKYKDSAVTSKYIEKLVEVNQIANKIADAIDNGEIGREQEQTLPGRSK